MAGAIAVMLGSAMAPKRNPLKLNPLQLRTLTLLQELARHPETSTRDPETGDTLLTLIPQAHGDHIHVGAGVALVKDATGLWNEIVWRALERKGLARSNWPLAIALTEKGLAYDTGLRHEILHVGDH
jgi:hypothetical protein